MGSPRQPAPGKAAASCPSPPSPPPWATSRVFRLLQLALLVLGLLAGSPGRAAPEAIGRLERPLAEARLAAAPGQAYLHAAPLRLHNAPDFHVAGYLERRPALAAVLRPADLATELFEQHPAVKAPAGPVDPRLGALFHMVAHQTLVDPDMVPPPSPAPPEHGVLVVPTSGAHPAYLSLRDTSIWRVANGPTVGASVHAGYRVLAARGSDSQFIHVLVQAAGGLTLLDFSAAGLTERPISLPAEVTQPQHLTAQVSFSGEFYVQHGEDVYFLQGDGPLTRTIADSAPAALATRLLTTQPSLLDMVSLGADRKLAIRTEHRVATGGTVFSRAIPEEVSLTGRFLNPPVTSLPADSPQRYLYYDDTAQPGGSLWRVDMDDALAWTRLIVPASLARAVISLVELDLSPSLGGRRWYLVAGGRVLLDTAAFCAGDPSVVCDVPGGAATANGWTCAPGRVLSPLLGSGALCGGCADGWRSEPADQSNEDRCIPCPMAKCQACTATECLRCMDGWLLGPDGCVAACPAATTHHGDRCLPHHGQAGFRLTPYADPGLSGTYSCVAATWLVPGASGGVRLRTPGSGPGPDGVLLFGAGAPAAAVAAASSSSSSAPPPPPPPPPLLHHRLPGPWPSAEPLPVTALPGGHALALLHAQARRYVEFAPLLLGAEVLLLGLACLADGHLAKVTFRCVPEPDGQACTPDDLPPEGLASGCTDLAPLGPGAVVAMAAEVATLWRVRPSDGQLEALPLGSWASMPGPFPAAGRPPLALLRDWPSGRTRLAPVQALAEGDPRVAGPLPGDPPAFPPDGQDPASAGALFAPVTLRAGRSAAGAEVVLSRVRATPGAGEPAVWEALHAPAGILPQARTAGLATEALVLAPLQVDPGPDFQVLAVDLPGDGLNAHPSALLLVTPQVVGLAALHCPAAGAACRLGPARLMPPPPGLLRAQDATAVAVGPPGQGLLLLAPATGPAILLHLWEDPCPEGTFPPACTPCHELCLACHGPGRADCTACRLALPLEPGVCLADCPPGTWADSAAGLCACHPGCLRCAPAPSPGAYECLECIPGTSPSPGNALPGRCLACHATCSECSVAGDPAACTRCWPGLLLHGAHCLDACPPGFWPDEQDTCQPCTAHCQSCLGPTACETCAPQYFPLGGQCARCDGTCAACDRADACLACQPGLIFLQTDPQAGSLCGSMCAPGEYAGPARCTGCHASCSLCAGAAHQCQVCAAGHRWSGAAPAPGATGTCVACPPGCTGCTPSKCLGCEEGLFLTHAGACVDSCPGGTFGDADTGTCQLCDVSCQECAGPTDAHCSACAPGLDPVPAPGGLWTCAPACPEGQFRPAGATDCQACHEACSTCNGPTNMDCWRCAEGVLQDRECRQACAAAHVAMAGRCLPCHASCESCTGLRSTECDQCPGDLLALPAGQSPVRCVAACPVGYHGDGSGCAACPARCASCPAQASACSLCERGWLLAAAACVTDCPAGSSAQGGLCSTCHGSCSSCYGPGPDHCLSCAAATPLQWGSSCLGECPAGTFDSASVCTPCHVTCATCTGPLDSQCITCPGDRALHAGACLAACPAGHFAEHPAADGAVCRPCAGSCGTCTGPAADQCTSCPGSAFLHGGRCVAACPGGTFACRTNGSCQPCDTGCRECTTLTSVGGHCAALCHACQHDRVHSPMTGRCEAACPPGEYDTLARGCATCAGPCRGCFGSADHCTSCLDPALWLEPGTGACVGVCPEGQGVAAEWPATSPWLPARVCLACPDGCERCAADSPADRCAIGPDGRLSCRPADTCTWCGPGLLLHAGACVSDCPPGNFADGLASPAACTACHPGCKECHGPGAGDCTGNSAGRSSLGLALGLGVGLLLLLVLVALAALVLWRRRPARWASSVPSAAKAADEDATILNTIVELSLPGSVLVSLETDFRREGHAHLGAGTQGTVYVAQAVGVGIAERLGCPATVAIKCLDPGQAPHALAMFQNEVSLLWSLREHRHILRLYGYSDAPPALVLHRHDADLDTLLRSEIALGPQDTLDIIHQWAAGVEIMHAHRLAHGDIKPGNVLVSRLPGGAWHAAVGDLGTARDLAPGRTSALVLRVPDISAMTIRYAAPEVLAAHQRRQPLATEHCLAADIYAAAIMLWECLTRTSAWPDATVDHITLSVRNGHRPELDLALARFSPGPMVDRLRPMCDLLAVAWQQDPHARPAAGAFRQRCAMCHQSTTLP
ncbi:TKL protein kinase [Fonticula alba]|uniref:TKL protein kinase n=1 Tax=Fonticula alba TaxID=691883 RepID=A0A058Z697_FONAL|nr:TKL protein kinase [Fonticula alba]KCV69795.1 TKL protein kinase [Fonticula alba]|eukprot:XP_009495401.1 TKL protein kinase [Fonticula alba]